MTKVEAIKKVLEDNGGIATWEIIYNEIEKYYPEAKKSKEWTAGIRGVLYREIKNDRSFKKIDEGTYSLVDYDINKLVLSPKDFITTKDVITAIRIGQNQFRKKLILSLKKCPITGINDVRVLTASHIINKQLNYTEVHTSSFFKISATKLRFVLTVSRYGSHSNLFLARNFEEITSGIELLVNKPWTQATNQERLDVSNGFLFSPTFDRLFDRGLISFSNNKNLLVSNTFSEKNLARLNLKPNQVISNLPVIGREEYLEYHRNKIFIHN